MSKKSFTDLNTIPLSELTELCITASNTQPILFFVGSGISIPYPSMLPSASAMVSLAINYLSPPQTASRKKQLDKELSNFENLLPEIFYENIVGIIGRDALKVWEVLRFWNDKPDLVKYSLGPNRAHILITYIAWKSNTPIITPNYDTFFEEAAKTLNLQPIISLPGGDYSLPKSSNEISIWKVHGSVDENNFSSIHSTLQSITTIDNAKINSLEKQFLSSNASVCLIGYSGRDIDLFPFILSWAEKNKVIWLDHQFSNWHNIYIDPDPFFAIKDDIEIFVNEVIAHPNFDPTIRDIVLNTSDFNQPSDLIKEIKTKYNVLINDYFDKTLTNLIFKNDPRRNYLHAISLHSVNMYQNAKYYIDKFIREFTPTNDDQRKIYCRALLLKTSLCHATSLYKDSEYFAKGVKNIAEKYDFPILIEQSTIAIDEAYRMQYLPRLYLNNTLILLSPRTWYLLIRLTIHAIKHKFSKINTTSLSSFEETQLEFSRIEHQIRLIGTIQGFINWPIIQKMTSPIFKKIWNQFDRNCKRIGYANGIGYINRYAERWGIDIAPSPVTNSINFFSFLGENTGESIAFRDYAYRLSKSIHSENDPVKRIKYRLISKEAFQKAYSIAYDIGNLSLALKILIELKKLDSDFHPNNDELDHITQNIQGRAYKNIEKKLINWFKS